MSAEYPLPVRYVLYTHYPEGDDFKEYRDYNTPPNSLTGIQALVKHLSGLQGLLTWPGYEGLLVLFYSPGLHECLTGIAEHKRIEVLKKTCKELEFSKAVHVYLDRLMKQQYPQLLPRLRFITALDLHRVFGRITNSEIADRLKAWMVGDTEGMRYDSPKIVEAIVRLRLLGSGLPVFRVDHDVLLRGDENCDKKNLEFSSTIGSCLTAYQLRRDSPNLSSFIFSASYDHQVLQKPEAARDFRAWGRAYATRVFPALPVNQKLINKTLKTIQKGYKEASAGLKGRALEKQKREIQAEAWDSYAAETFRPSLARKFLGFDDGTFSTSELTGIGHVGANPLASVISGAMLYLSDGAILDLPPFSNFSLNVSWIDDHLKYCLHRELRHLTRPNLNGVPADMKHNGLLAYAKIDDVIVQKAGRKIYADLRKYTFDVYLPTLLRGTVLDAWITPDPSLKYRREHLGQKKDRNALGKKLSGQSGGLLPSALQMALEACKFKYAERIALKKNLKQSALARISHVRREWAALTENGVETFASAWAKGQAPLYCRDLNLEYPGIVADSKRISVNADLSEVDLLQLISSDVTNLIYDASSYIKWTLDWPTIVQVVRSIEQGTLRTDLNYQSNGPGNRFN